MILKIRVDDLLRTTLATPSRDLVTRTTGAAIRLRIERAIADAPCPTTLLDFQEVGVLDFSCADEVVAKLLLLIEDEHYVVLHGVDETQAEAIDHVLSHQDLAIAIVPRAGGRQVLGRSTPDLLAAFEAVHAFGSGSPDRLADRLGWSVERTADALQTLALRRLILAANGTFSPLPLQ
jgi:hypothetical protein